ncbi:MAG: relaxase/mobilization nuclease domain-containing protein [Ancrocorticia sp.]
MAVVKIGQIRTSLNKAIGYICQAEKTQGGLQISTNCTPTPWDPDSITQMFLSTQRRAEQAKGVGRPGTILAYHVIQSFKPGEVHQDKAHDIGFEFAQKLTGNDYDFVVATHVDRGHIHNHIMFNSVNYKTLKRYRCPRQRLYEMRNLSDDLCRAHNLSVIEEPSRSSMQIGEVYARARGASTKQTIAAKIDEAIRTSFSWEAMAASLGEMGIEVSLKGNSVLFRDPATMVRPMRGKKLGYPYTEAAIMARLGRQTMCEVVVQKKMVTMIDEDRARLRVPGKRGHSIVIPRHRLNDHGATWHLFLPETTELTMVNSRGLIAAEFTAPALYDYFSRPDILRDITLAPETTRRGKSAAQERYFKRVDAAVEALHDEADVVNMLATYAALAPEQQTGYLAELRAKITEKTQAINQDVLARQNLLDHDGADIDKIDAAITRQGRDLRNLQAVHNKITKDHNHKSKGSR